VQTKSHEPSEGNCKVCDDCGEDRDEFMTRSCSKTDESCLACITACGDHSANWGEWTPNAVCSERKCTNCSAGAEFKVSHAPTSGKCTECFYCKLIIDRTCSADDSCATCIADCGHVNRKSYPHCEECADCSTAVSAPLEECGKCDCLIGKLIECDETGLEFEITGFSDGMTVKINEIYDISFIGRVLEIPETIDGFDFEFTVTEIGDDVFMNVIEVKQLIIPDTVEIIGERAFFGSGITSIVIPESVTFIGALAFSRAVNLNSVTFKSTSLEAISENYAADIFRATTASITVYETVVDAYRAKFGGSIRILTMRAPEVVPT
jgi:hypothetical protein